MIVAATTAEFSFPEVRLGLVAECGGLFRGPRALPLNIARELLLTGRPLAAPRAHQLGLVNHLTEPGNALAAAVELAEEIAAHAPVAVAESLAAVEAAHAAADAAGWETTARASTRARATDDAAEGVAAFLDRRPARFTGR
jgi:enoyl-CoA hydratase/carnithine racemase